MKDLREQERAVFGGAGTAAPFRLAMVNQRSGDPVAAPGINNPGGYVAFPAREERATGRPAMTLWRNVGAQLVFTGDRGASLPQGLREATELWLLVGGVGGRTRRGLGAVQARGGGLEVQGRPDLEKRLRHLLGKAPRGPKVGGVVRSVREVWLTQQTFPTGDACLFGLDHWYKHYRQDRPVPGQAGRSFWDEPERIRGLTGFRDTARPALPPAHLKHPPGFARAALGLPIVFQFNRPKDPPPTQLAGQNVERLASPLWFRPVRVGVNAWVGLVLLTSGPYLPTDGLLLTGGPNRWTPPAPTPRDVEKVFTDLLARGGLVRVIGP